MWSTPREQTAAAIGRPPLLSGYPAVTGALLSSAFGSRIDISVASMGPRLFQIQGSYVFAMEVFDSSPIL